MAGKTYSAGTIFLQVVPVFEDVQRKIEREVGDVNKALGDELEKGGREAGERATKAITEEIEKGVKKSGRVAASDFEKEFKKSIKGISDAIEPINLRTSGGNEVRRQLEDIKDELDYLGNDFTIKTNVDAKKAEERIRILSAHLQGLQEDASLTAKLNIARAVAAAQTFEKRLDNLQKAAEIEVRLEMKQADRALGSFEKKVRDSARNAASRLGDSFDPEITRIKKRLEDLADTDIGIDVSSEAARAEIDQLEADLRQLSQMSPDIDVKLNAGKAEAELAALTVVLNRLDGRDIDINVDVDAGAAVAKMGMLRSMFQGGGAEAAANSFRSFNAVVLAAVLLLPALVPVVGAVGGALLGLIPILAGVGAGIGAMLVGFSGIGDAVTALGDQANDSAKDTAAAAKTMQSASYAVVDARQGVADAERSAARAASDAARQVADARRSAADAIEDAIDRQREAQEAYRDSVQDVREAEADLREARKRAIEEDAAATADLKDQARQNKLDIREAILAAFDATNAYNATMADGSSTAYDKEAAEVAMLQARERLHELRDTEKEIAKDRKTQRKEGVDGNSAVESAQDALTAALERQRDAQEAVGDAAEAVKEARIEGARRVADAVRQQQRAEADGARSIARANEQLRRAQEAHAQALYDTGEIGSASMQKVEEAMGKLGPAGRKFAYFLFGLRDNFYAFRDAIQEAMLPGVQRAMETMISTYGPQFTDFMARMGGVVGDFFEAWSASLRGPQWREFFGIMDELGPKMTAQFGQTTLNWFEGFASILTAVAPFAERMSEGMLKMSEAFERWAASKKGQEAITDFMDYAERVGPAVLSFFGAFFRAIANLGRALAPFAQLVLEGLTAILNFIAEMDPKFLRLIVTSLLVMVVAWQAAVGAVAAFFGGLSAFQTIGGRVVFGIIGIAGVLMILASESETVRNALGDLFGFMSDHRDTLVKIAGTILGIVAAYKALRTILLVVKGIQIGVAVATVGLAGATTAQTIALTGNATAMKVHTALSKAQVFWTNAGTAAQWLLNTAFLGFPLIWIIVAVAAVVAAIVLLWKKNETFRKVVTKAWDMVKKAAGGAWTIIKKVIAGMGKAISWLWKNIVKPYFGFIWGFWIKVFKAIAWAWKNILWPIIDLFGTAIRKLWEKYVSPHLGAIGKKWDGVMTAMKVVWNTVLKPVWEGMKDGLAKLKDKFETVVSAIKTVWDSLMKIIGKPIKFVIESVLNNGLIAGFNKVAKFVGSKEMSEIPIPDSLQNLHTGGIVGRRENSFATGGVMPGYTPGRDIHRFVSPTGGVLNLSGGEPVMRPEFGRVVGHQWVDQANAAARNGGIQGVKRFLGLVEQSHAKGGRIVFPVPGGYINRSLYNVSHDGVDINHPNDASGNVPYFSATSGVVSSTGYNRGYGNAVFVRSPYGELVYGHSLDGSVRVRPGQSVRPGDWLANIGNTGRSSGPHLHFGFPGGSFQAAMGLLAGHVDASYEVTGGGKPAGSRFPGWLKDLARSPLGYVKDLISGPIDALRDRFGGNKFVGMIADVPGQLLGAVKDKVWDLVPGPLKAFVGGAKDIAGAVGKGIDAVVPGDGVPGLATGGIYGRDVPYNGTMMYDSGGYLPPGLTSVLNLTGKPEPVLTADQYEAEGRGGNSITYAPNITEANLTSEQLMDDFEFSIRKLGRNTGGKYEGAK